jgi:phospholipase/carboxylesterase
MKRPSRRMFTRLGLAAASTCAIQAASAAPQAAVGADGRLTARPSAARKPSDRRGEFSLAEFPQPLVFVPDSVDAKKPAPMILLLHGAGQRSERLVTRIMPAAQARGVIILAPKSASTTWDIIRSFRGDKVDFSEDGQRLNASLSALFAQYTIDTKHVAIGGFSDGASYALSLGPRNQDLFTHIMGFSPGGLIPFPDEARAKLFVSHGRQDQILSFTNSSLNIVPLMKRRGFNVRFEAFDDKHVFREEEITKAMDWFLG